TALLASFAIGCGSEAPVAESEPATAPVTVVEEPPAQTADTPAVSPPAASAIPEEPAATPPASAKEERLLPVRSGGKYGYIDGTGRMVIPPTFNFAGLFENGLALVERAADADDMGSGFGYI